ncbi:MAG: hypothetical protein ACRDQ5_08725 [Sciscionella sp.]
MSSMPPFKALLAVDVVGASAVEDDLLGEIRPAIDGMLRQAFDEVRLDYDERMNLSPTGDGDLMCFPEGFLPKIIDAACHLHALLYHHNRRRKPEIPMRVSIHTAPMNVSDQPSLQRGYIELTRMLEAAALKSVVRRCQRDAPFSLALILSDQAYRVAVLARRTAKLHPHAFAQVDVVNKEYRERCWVHVPGRDAARIAEFAAEPAVQRTPQDAPATSQVRNVNGAVQGNAINGDVAGPAIANFGQMSGFDPFGQQWGGRG